MLKDAITAGYSNIVALHEANAEVQRENVCAPIYNPIKERYPQFKGYKREADLGLGCAFPFLYANLKKGDTVADLGCASGIDSFIMAQTVGKTGCVYGFDITPSLIKRANSIKDIYQIEQVAFQTADISIIPLEDKCVDVCTSNGVFSLISNLDKTFKEVKRILKNGGVFCLSDINKKVNYDTQEYDQIKAFTGCLNGIRHQDTYLKHIKNIGFKSIEIVEERPMQLPKGVASQQGLFITTFKICS
ncbi:MAG: methyltransferase domain-containing protein [Flavobacteriales bacterium]|nr:methyltransferase domain-containing protein [Flavobacteriales bacterium]